MEEKDIRLLLEKYRAGLASDDEIALLESWYLHFSEDTADVLTEKERINTFTRVWANLNPVKVRRLWPRIAAAASILIACSVGVYVALQQREQPQVAQVQKLDALPGNQSAILQLSNGERINLTTAQAGNIATQGHTNIIKTADNKVVYDAGAPTSELVYNTVTTKRGNFYPLTLSDGTVAILDAGSSIKYPVNFIGKERRVEITGQVYFEVKHNAKMPFRVSVKGHTIEDIGTAFNINAYDDEPSIRTTLIEGSIKIADKTLTPGQQAIIKNGIIKVEQADTEQAIAWKNGLFNFNGMSVPEAMRQISRWYDMDVEYPEGTPKIIFGGEVHRNLKASGVFNMLKFFKVDFEIVQGSNGKKILVKP